MNAQISARPINATTLERFAAQLNSEEIDALKYRLSITAVTEIEKKPDDSTDLAANANFVSELLRSLVTIQPYRERIPEYGLAYLGRPAFMTDSLLEALQAESKALRPHAKCHLEQYISQVNTPKGNTVCEQLAASEELLEFVCSCAGPSLRSYVTSYLYYDQPGQRSKPHVDNAFTSITVMVGLEHTNKEKSSLQTSSSIIFWPDSSQLEYRLKPGELSIFFGSCVLHGRTRIAPGESVRSLLMSFRPKLSTT